MLVAIYVNNALNATKSLGIRVASYLYVAFSILLACVFYVLPTFPQIEISSDVIPYILLTGIALLVTALLTYAFLKREDNQKIIAAFGLSGMILLSLFITHAATINEKSIKPLALQLKPMLQADDEVVTFYKYYQDLPIYLERRITIVADWHAADIPQNDNWVREMWYGMPFQDTHDWLIEQNTLVERWNGSKRLFIITNQGYLKNLESILKKPMYMIRQYRDMVLLSNRPNPLH